MSHPQNIYNYCEKAMPDNSGRERIVRRRGKHAKRVINCTKSYISVMLCGNSARNSIPPYLIYKASLDHMDRKWKSGSEVE